MAPPKTHGDARAGATPPVRSSRRRRSRRAARACPGGSPRLSTRRTRGSRRRLPGRRPGAAAAARRRGRPRPRCSSVSMVSSLAASSRSAMAESQPLLSANAPTNVRILPQGRGIERQLDPAAWRFRELDEQGHHGGGEAAGDHPVLQNTARELRDDLREDRAVLEARADPEAEACDQALAIVQPVLDDDLHADDEERRHRDGDEAAATGPGIARITASPSARRRGRASRCRARRRRAGR